ncbi:GyrI-like domain-containing protein [Dyadobacter psychrotolerans]|uniref:AraC family transcriptional regulator n=1 Tax=Dyadobacter psychrotolerans TaxID=2541721 RepID=A0A4R5DH12_9BACT|nr:GyrI-like domain-containing protein [Dyadobacter psychrotolerans]TDE10025.1 AraC family transcriptional regulator [Dyadobacter psychrotolerans]
MQIRTIQPMQIFCFETETTLKDISQYIRVIARQLYSEAVKNELEITGPVYWIYDGADGQPDTKFRLTIALPISQNKTLITNSDFKIKTLDAFRCMSHRHEGCWKSLGEAYGLLIFEIQVKDPEMSGQNREIYLNMDFENPDANITEVQIGLL